MDCTDTGNNHTMKSMGICAVYCRTSAGDEDSIERQKKGGICFCEENGFEYHVYTDEGKSGFKMEDDANPFSHRPAFQELIADVKSGRVTKVWVRAQDRLSRNHYASCLLWNIFEKHKIDVYIKDRIINTTDPMTSLLRQIMDAIAVYERHLIVSRTLAGRHEAINRGRHSPSRLYGYEKIGRDEKGHLIWGTVESEQERLKHFFRRFFAGHGIPAIAAEFHQGEELTARKKTRILKHWHRVPRIRAYTSYNLNTDGMEILRGFVAGKAPNLSELLDAERFWAKSETFHTAFVTIPEWIKNFENIQAEKNERHAVRQTGRSTATGLVSCPLCGLKYFYFACRQKHFYRHSGYGKCGQRPKTFPMEKIDGILNTFYFYRFMVFDDTPELIAEAQAKLAIKRGEIRELVKRAEAEISGIDRQLSTFKKIYENPDSEEKVISLALRKEAELSAKKEDINEDLKNWKFRLDGFRRELNRNELELAYHDTAKKVRNFIENLTPNERKMELSKTMRDCLMYGRALLVASGDRIFIFNTKKNYDFIGKLLGIVEEKDNAFKDFFFLNELSRSKLVDEIEDEEEKRRIYNIRSKIKIIKNFLYVEEQRPSRYPLSKYGIRGYSIPEGIKSIVTFD